MSANDVANENPAPTRGRGVGALVAVSVAGLTLGLAPTPVFAQNSQAASHQVASKAKRAETNGKLRVKGAQLSSVGLGLTAVVASKGSTGLLRVVLKGSGAYKVKGVGFKATAKRSKSFKLPPGRYVVTPLRTKAHSRTVRVSKGKRTRVLLRLRSAPKNEFELISVGKSGKIPNGASVCPAWSPDGSRIAFVSVASNLVKGGGRDGAFGLFVKKLNTGHLTRVKPPLPGMDAPPAIDDVCPSWSPDGSKILSAWLSLSGGSGSVGAFGVYITDVTSGKQTLLEDVGSSGKIIWSPDGTQVAYISDPAQETGVDRVFTRTLATGETRQVFPRDGVDYPYGTRLEQLTWSPDGSRLAFVSESWWLVDGDTNRSKDVFVLTLGDGQLQRVSTSGDGTQARDDSEDPVWSPDGGRIAFVSYARNLVPIKGDVGGTDVYVKTLATGAIQRVAGKRNSDVFARDPAWSPDGRRIAFSAETALAPASKKLQSSMEIFVETLDTGALRLISTGSTSKPVAFNEGSSSPRWSPDGSRIAFVNHQGELIKGVRPGADQIYMRKLR